MALGAMRWDIVTMIMRESLNLVLPGLLIGLVVALGAGRFIDSLLYGLSATDPLTIVISAVIMTAVAAFAGYLPARRASRVDPMRALHYE